jgi:hypothetical protein
VYGSLTYSKLKSSLSEGCVFGSRRRSLGIMSSPPSIICPSPTLRPALKRESLKPLPSTSVHLEPPNSTPPVQSTGVHLVKVPTSTSLTPGYTNKVSFDTFENSATAAPSDAAMFSFTLQVRLRAASFVSGTLTRGFLIPRPLLKDIKKIGTREFIYVLLVPMSLALKLSSGRWSR